ncbi:hypothetical protein [Halorussus halophilus]|uniref:hypothetical protein n=1 Tax=Halorussus halophilus TaxID=2650975 RepID=UPI001300E52F|nr:hypothetical protein [Halorussus halophilus]
MGTDAPSPVRTLLWLLVIGLVLVPVAMPWLNGDFLPELDGGQLVRFVGLGVTVFVLLWLIWQKRRTRGIDNNEGRVEGSGESYENYAYNEQQAARREGERIHNEAERLSELDRKIERR